MNLNLSGISAAIPRRDTPEPVDLNAIASEIRELHEDVVHNAILIGRLLVKAKDALPRGKWGGWVEANCKFKQQQANRYMRVFEASKLSPEAQFLVGLSVERAAALAASQRKRSPGKPRPSIAALKAQEQALWHRETELLRREQEIDRRAEDLARQMVAAGNIAPGMTVVPVEPEVPHEFADDDPVSTTVTRSRVREIATDAIGLLRTRPAGGEEEVVMVRELQRACGEWLARRHGGA